MHNIFIPVSVVLLCTELEVDEQSVNFSPRSDTYPQYGSQVEFTCKPGFEHTTGNAMRNCTNLVEPGKEVVWTGSNFTCTGT